MTNPLLDFTPEELEAVRAILLRYAYGLVKQTKQLNLQGKHVFPASDQHGRSPLASEVDLVDDTRRNVTVLLELLNVMVQPHDEENFYYAFDDCKDAQLEAHLPESLSDKYQAIYDAKWFVFDDEADEEETDKDFHEHDDLVHAELDNPSGR